MSTAWASDEVVRECLASQSVAGKGPCLDSAATGEAVLIANLQSESRWETWRHRVPRTSRVRSLMCLPILADGVITGGLILVSNQTDAFGQCDIELVGAIARSTGLRVATMAKLDQLESALSTRSTIGQAMGVLMATYRINDQEAFRLLSRLASQTNVKLSIIAARIVAQHNAGDYILP